MACDRVSFEELSDEGRRKNALEDIPLTSRVTQQKATHSIEPEMMPAK